MELWKKPRGGVRSAYEHSKNEVRSFSILSIILHFRSFIHDSLFNIKSNNLSGSFASKTSDRLEGVINPCWT